MRQHDVMLVRGGRFPAADAGGCGRGLPVPGVPAQGGARGGYIAHNHTLM
jgi:hypothetical protein